MAKLSRLISRGALVLMLLVSLLCSAGCGCGGGSAGPPAPDYDRDYYPHGIYPPGLHPGYPYEPYYPEKIITRAGQYLVREARLTGASFIEDAEHSRVTMAATDGLEEFGRAYYLPQAVAGWPAEADVTTTAYAIYSFGSAGFLAPVYIETEWAGLAPSDGNLFIGVWRFAHDRWLWTWYNADRCQRALLNDLDDYRGLDARQTIYVTVLVSGDRPCALDGIALRQYRW